MSARLVITVGLLGLGAGCAGAQVQLTARNARYPISMSSTVRDGTGVLLDTRSLKVVSRFHVEKTRIGILYSGVAPGGALDISDDVNAQIAAAQGEAIIRLVVQVGDDCNVLNTLPVLNAIPFWPGCVPVTIDGVIVRHREPPAAVEPAPQP